MVLFPTIAAEVSKRPLLGAAAAVFAGSGLGASGTLSSGNARALLLAVLVACVAAACLRIRLRIRTSGAGLPAVLAILLGSAALVAGSRRGAPPGSTEEPIAGTWRSLVLSGDRQFGRVDGSREMLAVPAGSLADGDEVLFLPRERPSEWARGPQVGPSRSAGRDRPATDVELDGLVRLRAASPGPLETLESELADLRLSLLARISSLSRPLTRGLVSGLLFGDLSEMPEGVPDLFVRTGTYHLLAISGLQVALVAVLLVGPLARAIALLLRVLSVGRVRPRSEVFRAVLLLLFVPIAGAGAPVSRSALAWALGSIAPLFPARISFASHTGASRAGHGDSEESRPRMPRTPDSLSLWSLALLVECFLHPDASLSLSVQLSYGSTLGLILATAPIAKCLRDLLPAAGRIGDVGRTGRARPALARVMVQRIADGTLYAVAASIAAVSATLPVVWSRFGEWSPAGIFATPLVALPVAWTLLFGWAWLLAPSLVPEALLDLPLEGTVRLLEVFDQIPGSPCPLPPRPFPLLVLAGCLAILAFRRLGRRGNGSVHGESAERESRALLPRATALVWAILILPWTARPSGLEVHALDVGHGTAVVVRSPGGSVWIFDAGSRDRPGVDREALGPLLRRFEAGEIGIVLSHADRDHDGALDWVVERYPPEVWAGALPAHLAARLPHTTVRIDVMRGAATLPNLDRGSSGLALELSRGLDLPGNEGSRVLEVRWESERLVLSGDAEEAGLSTWLRDRPAQDPARLLLLPHHGSDSEILGRLLERVRPEEVWISASGAPVLSRELERRGIPWRSTSLHGPLMLALP